MIEERLNEIDGEIDERLMMEIGEKRRFRLANCAMELWFFNVRRYHFNLHSSSGFVLLSIVASILALLPI